MPLDTRTPAIDLKDSGTDIAELAARVAAEIRRDIGSDDDQILTRHEAAAFLKRHPKTLEAWAKVGSGPRVTRFGPRSLGYRMADLREFIRNPQSK
jgi:hypothetical protein